MATLLCAIPILWAAVMDYRKRIIPDWTWIAILLIGAASAFLLPYPALLERIVGFLLPGLCLFFLAVNFGGNRRQRHQADSSNGLFALACTLLRSFSLLLCFPPVSMQRRQSKKASRWPYF